MASNSKSNDEQLEKEAPCFFCSKDSRKQIGSKFDPDLSSSKPVFVINHVSLRHVSRFLQIFEEVESGAKSIKKELYAFANDSTVPVCDGCSKLTKEFSKLYQVLDETKLKLNWCIQKMRDVMATTNNANTNDDDHDHSATIQTDVNVNNDEAKNLMATLKFKIIERMKAVTQLVLPRVILRKTKMSSSSSPQVTSKDKPADIQSVNLTVQQEVVPKPCDESTSTADRPSCQYCHAQFQNSNSFYGKWMLRQHLFRYHCEHFFPNEKLDNVTDSQYKKILSDLLFKDLIPENGCCSFCSKKFTGRKGVVNVAGIRSHLVESHYEELKERLMRIQKDPNLLETLSRCNPQGMVFESGGNRHGLGSQIEIGHEENRNLELATGEEEQQQLDDLRPPAPTPKSIKNLPKVKINSELPSVLQSKKVPLAPALVLADYKSNFVPCTPKQTKFKCKLCNKIVPRSAMQSHSKNKNECIPAQPIQMKMMTLATSNVKDRLSCPYCRVEFPGNIDNDELFTNHLVQIHPEHFFQNVRQNLPLVSVTNDQFQRIIHNILFPLIKISRSVSPSDSLCCKTFYSNANSVMGDFYLKKHLIEEHRSNLNQRLVEILIGPNLTKKLADLAEKGYSCPCGMYIPKWGNESEKRHKKFHCKLVTSESNSIATGVGVDEHEFLMQEEDADGGGGGGTELIESVPIEGQEKDSSTEGQKIPANDTPEDKTYLQCSYCRAKFLIGSSKSGSRTSLRYLGKHMIQHHLEHFFANCKLDSITHFQFQEILAQLLFKKVIDFVADEKEKTTCRCHFCSKPFTVAALAKRNSNCNNEVLDLDVTNVYFLNMKFHILQFHRVELKETLLEIQRDPNLKEMLKECDGNGRVCQSCGLYLANTFVQRFHEERYCPGMKDSLESNQCTSDKPAEAEEEPTTSVNGMDEDYEADYMSESEENVDLEEGEFLFEEEFTFRVIKTEIEEDENSS